MSFELIESGEIRFGPRFFNLITDGIHRSSRIFGEDIYEFDDKKYLVLQEWLSTDYSKGPITRPLIINKEMMMFATLSEGKKGFSSDFCIKAEFFQYNQINKGTEIIKSYECELSELKYIHVNFI